MSAGDSLTAVVLQVHKCSVGKNWFYSDNDVTFPGRLEE
jgi:hypothetical protein